MQGTVFGFSEKHFYFEALLIRNIFSRVYGKMAKPDLPKSTSFDNCIRLNSAARPLLHSLKKRDHGNRSWIQIGRNGDSQILDLDKASLMSRCHLPARDLRLLDPLFVYPSTILGREKAIVVNLEQIRCIITADEVFVMNSLDGWVKQYELELCRRLATKKDANDDLPFEFRALEVALELACMFLDSQATELEIEVYHVLDKLAVSISTLNLEHSRRLKSHLVALTSRVQKVHDEIEQLMDDDRDMAGMYLTEKKARMEEYSSSDQYLSGYIPMGKRVSKSAPVSPVSSMNGPRKMRKASRSITSSSKNGSSTGSSTNGERIEELEMLLEAYFVAIGSTLSKLLSLKEYVDDTEDFINIKLDNIQNQLIQYELLLTAAIFVVSIFAVVTGVFGMNIEITLFDYPLAFNWVLIITSIACGVIYLSLLLFFKHKKVMPL